MRTHNLNRPLYGLLLMTNEFEEFLARLSLIEGTREVTRGGNGALLLNTPHLHAHVLGLNDNHNAKRLKGLLYCLANLQSHAFLYLQTMAVAIDNTSNL